MKKETYFKTKDQFIASTLYALEQTYEGKKFVNNKYYLYFSDRKKCEEIVNKYYANKLNLNPRKLFDAFNMIKTIIYQK
jgi:hypothetical protein